MSARALLLRLRRMGVRLFADPDQLRYNAPAGVVGPGLQAELRAHKSEILTALRRSPASTG